MPFMVSSALQGWILSYRLDARMRKGRAKLAPVWLVWKPECWLLLLLGEVGNLDAAEWQDSMFSGAA